LPKIAYNQTNNMLTKTLKMRKLTSYFILRRLYLFAYLCTFYVCKNAPYMSLLKGWVNFLISTYFKSKNTLFLPKVAYKETNNMLTKKLKMRKLTSYFILRRLYFFAYLSTFCLFQCLDSKGKLNISECLFLTQKIKIT
jgi:hypothetical protein